MFGRWTAKFQQWADETHGRDALIRLQMPEKLVRLGALAGVTAEQARTAEQVFGGGDGPKAKLFGLIDAGDAPAAGRKSHETLGCGPWDFYTLKPPTLTGTRLRGEAAGFKMRVALATDAGGLQYELIHPLAGPSIYTEFLDRHGEGQHHVACDLTRSFEDTVAAFAGRGVKPVMEGKWLGIQFAYLDTEPTLNTVIEIF